MTWMPPDCFFLESADKTPFKKKQPQNTEKTPTKHKQTKNTKQKPKHQI